MKSNHRKSFSMQFQNKSLPDYTHTHREVHTSLGSTLIHFPKLLHLIINACRHLFRQVARALYRPLIFISLASIRFGLL